VSNAEGQSVAEICERRDQPSQQSVYSWLRENGHFLERYTAAREQQADKLFREIIEIADDAGGDYVTTSDGKRIVDHENIQRSRLRVDARKWAAARLAPKKYGDRVEHDHRGGLNFQPAVLVQIGGGERGDVNVEADVSGKLISAEPDE
jgi:sugar phosphate isomerase/epimerase